MKSGRPLALVALGIVASCSSGCFPFPHYEDPERDPRRQNVEQELREFPVAGLHTRADVILRLGEPDEQGREDECILYTWRRIVMIWAVGGQLGGIVGTLRKTYALIVEFGPDGLVTRCERKTLNTWHESEFR